MINCIALCRMIISTYEWRCAMEDQKEPDYLAEIVVESGEHPVVPYTAPPAIISGEAELIREAEPIKPDVEVLMNELKKLGEVMVYNYGAVWRVMVKVRKKGAE